MQNINDLHLYDKETLYNQGDPDVITMYLTVRRGNTVENTNHSWSEVNQYSAYDYEKMGVKPKKLEKNIYSISGGEYLLKNFFKETILNENGLKVLWESDVINADNNIIVNPFTFSISDKNFNFIRNFCFKDKINVEKYYDYDYGLYHMEVEIKYKQIFPKILCLNTEMSEHWKDYGDGLYSGYLMDRQYGLLGYEAYQKINGYILKKWSRNYQSTVDIFPEDVTDFHP